MADTLEERLADMDRRLREVQAELAPELEPPAAIASAPEPRPSSAPRGQDAPRQDPIRHEPLRQDAITTLYTSLLASMRRLLDGYEAVALSPPAAHGLPSGSRDRRAPGELTVSAGPLASAQEVRELTAVLAQLPGVSAVTVRGYEGTDRVILDVELS